MRDGAFPDGAHVLRLKIDMASPNINLRDPAIYRIRHAKHHRTGDRWCVYPLYDYTHCISDALERITHSICTLEFQDHRPLYDWVIERLAEGGQLERPLPQQYEFARLNLTYVVLSKRKLIQLVEGGHVDGWDDPRMPTLVGARRRGFTPGGFRLFAERIGVSKSDAWIDMSVLEDAMRDDLNAHAERRIAVLDPVRLVIDNFAPDRVETCHLPNHPQKPELGTRALPLRRELLIDREDFAEVPPKGFFRLSPGAEVRLRYGYVVRCTGFEKGAGRPRLGGARRPRRADAERHAGRGGAQGEGQHPLARRRRRGRGRGAALRPPVPRAVPGRARAGGRARSRRRCRVGHAAVVAGEEDDTGRAGRARLPRRPQSGRQARHPRVRGAVARRGGAGDARAVRAPRLLRRRPGRPPAGEAGVQPLGHAQGLLGARRRLATGDVAGNDAAPLRSDACDGGRALKRR